MRPMADKFAKAMQLMRKHDPQLQESGFGMLRGLATDVLPDLLEAYETETDHGLKCWLLELIGEAQSEDALPLLARELRCADESLRLWAHRGLERLGTKAARAALWQDQQSQA